MNLDLETLQEQLTAHGYVADRAVATPLFLASQLQRPLLIEGPTGVGKTEVAKVLSNVFETELIRLQCYEGIDVHSALYEWNYQKQLLHIRLDEGRSSERTLEEREADIFSKDFLMERPLLRAITRETPPVLLIDEVDRADEEFEAFLLELLAEWQVSVPELGTIEATTIPYTILTSNRTRPLSEALRRRSLYLWLDYPSFEREMAIVQRRISEIGEALTAQVVGVIQMLRRMPLENAPGVAETLDWAAALAVLDRDRLDSETLETTLGTLLKGRADQERLTTPWIEALCTHLDDLVDSPDRLTFEQTWRRVESAVGNA